MSDLSLSDLPFVRHPRVRMRFLTLVRGPSLTQQSHAEECDIKNIRARYDRTGQLPSVNSREAQFGDVSHLQGSDMTTLMQRTIDVGIEGGKALETHRARQKAEVDQRQIDLETEIARLRHENELLSAAKPA